MIDAINSRGRIHLIERLGTSIKTLAYMTPEEANKLALDLLKKAAIIATVAELKGIANEQDYH